MGKTITPKYRVVYTEHNTWGVHREAWDCTQNGKPNDDNLTAWVKKLELSYRPNDCNEHIAKAHGESPIVVKAYIQLNTLGDSAKLATYVWTDQLECTK
jgi:hypothetical protein